jgi:hypothetical protein
MAGTKINKRFDMARLRRTYPFVRRKPRYAFKSDDIITFETAALTFTIADTGSHIFAETFTSAPIVTVTSVDTGTNANVNVWVSQVTSSTITVRSSAIFTGEVHIHALLIEEGRT